MFTGIVEKTGLASRHQRVLTLRTDLPAKHGESIAVDGVCLTVREAGPGSLYFDLADETLIRTRLGKLGANPEEVNLERALEVGARLGGHFVQGHVDGVGSVVKNGRQLEVLLPLGLDRYCVVKGSIALNGVSLTIHSLTPFVTPEGLSAVAAFELVPFTLEHTNLKHLRETSSVNLEVDLLARYAEKLWQPRLSRNP